MVGDIVSAFHWFRDLLYQLLKAYQGFLEPALGTQSYWVAIVLLTLTVRVVMIPLVSKQVRSQRAMAELAPEIRKLQAKYKDDRQRLNQEMMALYQERGANPMAGCLPLLVQAPFFLALYHVIYQRRIAGEDNILLNHGFFGIRLDTVWWRLDGWGERLLSVEGLVILAVILVQAVVMYISMRQMMAKQSVQMAQANAQAQQMQQTMLKVMPVMLGVVGINIPLAVLIYWATSNLWQWGQQTVMLRIHPIKTNGAATADTKTPAKGTAKGGKPANAAPPARRGGLFANFRAQLADAQAAVQQRNGTTKSGAQAGSAGRRGGATRDPGKAEQARAEADGQAQEGTGGGQGAGTPRKRSSGGGRKAASPSRSGGGKGGASSRQRRRKR